MNSRSSTHSQRASGIWSGRFLCSASALWLAFALVLSWYNLANLSLVPPHEPLTGLSLRNFLWIVGGLSLLASVFCLLPLTHFTRIVIVICLAMLLAVYQIGLPLLGTQAMRACFRSFASLYALSPVVTQAVFDIVLAYFIVGGAGLLAWPPGTTKSETTQNNDGELKTTCGACGGRIAFSQSDIGKQIACPHCHQNTILHGSENLKMTCFFCHKHIEFPAHAAGTKMPCPHCHKDITLKEI
jgi:DNA-directed RNA polymerase subunit RPC12/RpoP